MFRDLEGRGSCPKRPDGPEFRSRGLQAASRGRRGFCSAPASWSCSEAPALGQLGGRPCCPARRPPCPSGTCSRGGGRAAGDHGAGERGTRRPRGARPRPSPARKPLALSCVSASPFDSVVTSALFPQTPFLLGQSKLVLFLSFFFF